MGRKRRLRMNLPVALLLAALLHVLLLLGTEVFPGLRAAWIPDMPERPPQPEPLSFTFVDLPREPPEPETPPEDAAASDRTRRASSPQSPEEAPPSPDPFSEGNTDQRVDSQPAPEVAPQQDMAPSEPRREEAMGAPEATREEPEAPELPSGRSEMFPAPREAVEDPAPDREADPGPDGLMGAMRPFNSRDVQRFDNPGTASVTDFGPISFDTVGIDWGPYARKIVEIIRARWLERMPQAARLGLKGRSVITFRITLDGNTFAIVLEDGSGHRALDKAAEFSIEGAELPPLPPEFLDLEKDDVGVTFQFYYNMRIPQR